MERPYLCLHVEEVASLSESTRVGNLILGDVHEVSPETSLGEAVSRRMDSSVVAEGYRLG